MRVVFTILAVLCAASTVRAQTTVPRERDSLRGIQGFYLMVDVEGTAAVVEHEALEVTGLRQRIRGALEDAGLRVLEAEEYMTNEGVPYLYVHVNTMDAGRGLFPFAIETRFYQTVTLPHRRSAETQASTWDTGVIGLVSADQLAAIAQSAVDLLDTFIEEYRQVNL